ncbi:hypothetical protein QE152_g40698, partial [Popillia japonica]
MNVQLIARVLAVIVFFTSNSQSARILAIFHIPSKSHAILGETLLKELARNGHEVTMVSPFPQKTPVPNYRDVALVNLPREFE